MGWGRMLLFGNFGQQMDIEDQRLDLDHLRDQLDHSSSRLSRTSKELRALQAENDELKLYIAAILRALVSKNIVTQAELQNLVTAIDREDGDTDGGFQGDVMPPSP